MPRLRTSSSRMASTWVCTVTSSAEVGSSAIRMSGPGDQHHGDHDALAHAAGDLVRIMVVDALGVADMHGLEHLQRRAPGVAACCCEDGCGASRRSAGPRSSPDRASISGPAAPWRCACRAAGESRVRRGRVRSVSPKPQSRRPRCGPGRATRPMMARPVVDLPEPDFADDAQALAAQGEGHVAHRADIAVVAGIGDAQVAHGQQRAIASSGAANPRRRAARRPAG